MTTTTTTTKINAKTLAAFIRHADAIATTADAGRAIVEETKWTALERLIGAYTTLGTDVAKLAKLANVKSADALAKAFRNEDNAVYVATDQRSELPSASRMSRALALQERHNSERFTAYREASDDAGNVNSARLEDYVLWLALVVTGKTTSDKVDVTAMSIAGTGAKRKVGPLVRIKSAVTTKEAPSSPTVVGFFADIIKMNSDELTTIIADGPIDVDSIPMTRRRDVARQLMASVTLAEMSDRVVVTLK